MRMEILHLEKVFGSIFFSVIVIFFTGKKMLTVFYGTFFLKTCIIYIGIEIKED